MDDNEVDSLAPKIDELRLEQSMLADILWNAKNGEPEIKLTAVKSARMLISRNLNPPIDDFIESGLLPILFDCLQEDDNASLQFEASWIITNIASGSSQQTQTVVQAGAVSQFIRLLSSKHENVRDNAVWGLGNIIGDGANLRDYAIQQSVVTPLLALIHDEIPARSLRNITWVIVNLCSSGNICNKESPPPMGAIQQLLLTLNILIQHSDLDVLVDSTRALSFIAESGEEYIQAVLQVDVIPTLVSFLTHSESRLQIAAVIALRNIVVGTDEQKQSVLDNNVLHHFPTLLSHTKRLRREALRFLSAVTAGTEQQVQAVIDAGLIPLIIKGLTEDDIYIPKEAALIIFNMTVSGYATQVAYAVQCGCIPPLCSLLAVQDSQIIHVVLDGLTNILKMAGDDADKICLIIEECSGLDKIESLQKHENVEIYKLAFEIIEKCDPFPD